ncbi:MAG: pyrroloquinoline quinone-dependent dehydrogenase [Steroidobacter sp.]|nr:pyrroloquinoline quinone-dependent dehydrogenase [Steroidobacter sp.]
MLLPLILAAVLSWLRVDRAWRWGVPATAAALVPWIAVGVAVPIRVAVTCAGVLLTWAAMTYPKRALYAAVALALLTVITWSIGIYGLRADLDVKNFAVAPSGTDTVIDAPWTHFAASASATQYTRALQITPQNVADLELAWVYRTGETSRRDPRQVKKSDFANTPIIAGGSLIACTAWNRIIALDPASGAEKWVFDPGLTIELEGDMKYVCRSVAAWRDPDAPNEAPCAERLLMGTNDLRIFAIDARSGQRCEHFGHNGEVQVEISGPPLSQPGAVKFNAPPMVVNGIAIFGSAILDGYLPNRPRGTVRAFDARTGEPKWTFEPLPDDPTDAAALTWNNGNSADFGGGNVWADMSSDAARDLVFLPTSSPSMDHYGGLRPGDNRYANSIVALRAATGKIVWSYQTVHHDIWDYDLPSAPMLIDLEIKGRTVPAVVQLTKQGLVFVLHRETGEPLFPIEERPFPASDLAGEWTSPTQPIPATMPALMPQGLRPEDAWGITLWDRERCRETIARYRSTGLYDPVSVDGTIMFPLYIGGTNLGMRAYDPQRKLLIASTIRIAASLAVADNTPGNAPANATAVGPYRHGLTRRVLSPFDIPCNPPPWGTLMALDLERQKIVWEVPLGSIEKLGRLPIPIGWGTPSRGGPMLTGGGVTFIAATMDDAIRAFDTASGKELWKRRLPAGGQATPMSYIANGRQYVVIAAGGHQGMGTTSGDYMLAFALPN